MKRFFVGVIAAVALAIPAAAVADSCANVSRPAPECNLSCTSLVTDGNWIWLPSIPGIGKFLPPLWGFAPPGAEDSQNLGLPGSNGNYTNAQTSSLLGMSAICQGGGNVQNARQGTSGIQSGCE